MQLITTEGVLTVVIWNASCSLYNEENLYCLGSW